MMRSGISAIALALLFVFGCASKTEIRNTSSAAVVTNAAPAVTRAPAAPSAVSRETQQLFDGKTLTGWRISDFAGSGAVKVEDGKLILEMGTMTGVTYTSSVPTMNYEISLDAMRVDGSDFFCGLTFPVGKDPCSLI